MSRTVDFYFSMVSPWVYIGDSVFNGIVARHGLGVHYRPLRLPSLFEQTGGLPLAKRHPTRQAHRWLELQRWREARGIPLNLQPKHWPFPSDLADRTVIAAGLAGLDPAAFISAALHAVWAEEADLGDRSVVERLATASGLPAAELLARATDDETAKTYDGNIERAIEAGVFGSPSVVLDGELFWGQDRYELLDQALESGRPAFHGSG